MAKNIRKSPTTPGLDVATERFCEISINHDQWDDYPDGAVFVAADLPDMPQILDEAITNKEPVVLIYPDGREHLIIPDVA